MRRARARTAAARRLKAPGLQLVAQVDVRVLLRLAADDDTRALWSSPFTVSLTLSLGATLAMTAEVENVGHEAIVYGILTKI